MANPFLARLLDTQQRGLQAERERQMRNNAFGNLGFLGQSLQRSFQPLAEMRQREALQKQAEDARMAQQTQQQDFEQQQVASELGIQYDPKTRGFFKETPAQFSAGGQLISPAGRQTVSPAQIRADIDAGKAANLAKLSTEQSIKLYGDKKDIDKNELIENLGGVLTEKGLIRVPLKDEKGNLVLDPDGKVIYSKPVTIEQAVQASELNKLRGETEVTEKSKINVMSKANQYARNNKILDLRLDQQRYKTITKPEMVAELLYKKDFAEFSNNQELAQKFAELGQKLESGEVTVDGKGLQEFISDNNIVELNKKLDTTNKNEAKKLGIDYSSDRGFFETTYNADGTTNLRPVNFAEVKARVERVDPQKQILQEQTRLNIKERKAEVDNSIKEFQEKQNITLDTEKKKVLQEIGGVISEDGSVEIREVFMSGTGGQFGSRPRRFGSIQEAQDYLSNKKFEDKYGKQLAADLNIKKIEQLDPVLQGKYAENAKNLAKAQAEGSAEGRNTVDIENEQRGLIMANLAKGVRSAIKTGENVDINLINRLVGDTLPDKVKEQLVQGYKVEKDATDVESLVTLANNPLISEADRFAILQQVPQNSGGLKGVKGQDNKPLKYTDFARNEKLLNNLLDEGRILDAPPEERERLMRDSGYTTPAQQKAVLQIAEKKENERLIKEIERNILNAFEIDPEEVGESVGVLERSTKLDKLWEEQLAGNNGKNKRAIEAAGLTKASFLGSVEKIRRNVRAAEAKIQKDRATAEYTLSGKGSSTGAAKQNTYDKIFQKEFGEILRKYDGNIKDQSFIAEIEDLRVTIYGSKTGGPSDVIGLSSVAPVQPIRDEIESRLNQQTSKQAVEQPSPQVNETVVQPPVNETEVDRSTRNQGFISAPSNEVSTPTGALRETAQAEDQNLSKSLLSKAYAGVRQKRIYKRVMDTIGGGDTKRGEIEFLNQALGKTDEEIKQIIEENRPMVKKGRGGQEKLPLNQEDVEVLIKAVRAAERFRKEPETEI